MDNVTELLRAWGEGNAQAGDQAFSVLYDQLRELARHHAARASGASLQPTALVNEAFLRIASSDHPSDWRDRTQFFAFAAVVMRRVMIDYARYRKAGKRDRNLDVSFEETFHDFDNQGLDLEDLDEALTRLATVDARQSRIVELRFFGGMTVEETAEFLNISTRTVNREWGMAKLWLASALKSRAA